METSLFWGGTSTGDAANSTYGAPYSDDTFSDFFAVLANLDRTKDGVVFTMDARYSGMFAASVDHDNALVSVSPGAAMVDGKLYLNNAVSNFVMTSNGIWQLVLRKDFNAQTVRMVFRLGSSVTQSDGSIWEIELWRVSHSAGGVGYSILSDSRKFLPMNAGKYPLQTIRRDQTDIIITETQFIFNLNEDWPFKTLRVEWENMDYESPATLAYGIIGLKLNGSENPDYFSYKNGRVPGASAGTWTWEVFHQGRLGYTGVNGAKGFGFVEFPNWNTDDSQKPWKSEGWTVGAGSDEATLGGAVMVVHGVFWDSARLTSIQLLSADGATVDDWAAGCRATLYGII